MEGLRALLGRMGGGLALPLVLLLLSTSEPSSAQAVTGQASRADFRPLSRADDKVLYQMRRPLPATSRKGVASQRLPDITGGRAGMRKAVPVTRGKELGLQFRPDERDPVQGLGAVGAGSVIRDDEAQQQFRPVPRRRKPTYEDLEAERRGTSQPAQTPLPLGYAPLQPPLLAPYGAPWLPRW